MGLSECQNVPRGKEEDARRQGWSNNEWEKSVARKDNKPQWTNMCIPMTN